MGAIDDGVICLPPLALAPTRSPTLSSFNPEKLLPEELIPQPAQQPESIKDISSRSDSVVSAVFEQVDEAPEHTLTEHTQITNSPDEPTHYDLKPPPPSVSVSNAENLHDRLYSADHLNVILQDTGITSRFSYFLQQYRPHLSPVLSQYLEVRKAKAAIDYANAVAENMTTLGPDSLPNTPATTLNQTFESRCRQAEEKLVSDALPAYITHRLVLLVTDCLVKEITGNSAPIMQELISGLAEVYCMTDPSLPDNPIVYASEEFYRTTQYGREYVIGRNCRFLQGPKTAQHSADRLVQALSSGVECCETILNYRRDGTPFINLLMVAPLFDNKGRVRYFIGCQIDISNLIDGGRGLESFRRLLAQDKIGGTFDLGSSKSSLNALDELGHFLSEEEMRSVLRRSSDNIESGRTTPARPGTARRYIGMDDPMEQNMWSATHYGPSGRSPGVYQNVGSLNFRIRRLLIGRSIFLYDRTHLYELPSLHPPSEFPDFFRQNSWIALVAHSQFVTLSSSHSSKVLV